MDPPWTTCLLTRILISYLDAQKERAAVDYAAILGDTAFVGDLEGQKAYLTNDNNWVPHVVLQRLIEVVEQIVGSKDAAHHAARDYFPSARQSPLMEMISSSLRNVNQVIAFSSLWASGYTNYLRLQCVLSDDPTRCEATLLSQFDANTTPRIGNFHLVRGCYEGISRWFDNIEHALCTEEISQLTLESVLAEFDGYHLERREEPQWADWLFVVDTASKQEVAAAQRIILQTETLPAVPTLASGVLNAEGTICPPVDGQYRLIVPKAAPGTGPTAYQIMHQGRLQNRNGTTFLLRTGAYFNAPYSRYRFTWKTKGMPTTTGILPSLQPPSEIVPLLLRHVGELRETHRRLLQCFIDRHALIESHRSLHAHIKNHGTVLGLMGQTPVMQAMFEQVLMVAPTNATVLIIGDTGVGKEVLARAIHRSSLRREKPLYTVNCAALTESLLEAELFGHEKGAFTGAVAEKKGVFETANGGTLFLDEVSECSPAIQAKLLQVLENREVQRIGGRKTLRVDVRILAASHRNLSDCVSAGTFRKDLFYHLNVVSLTIPPLRHRAADIPFLIDYFLEFYSRQYRKPKPRLSQAAQTLLVSYDWPGNVRQLKNEIERLVLFNRDQVILSEHILLTEAPPSRFVPDGVSFHEAVEEFRRSVIETALKKAGGNQTLAASRLGLQRTYLSRLMRQFGLHAKP